MSNVIQVLQERGLLDALTAEELRTLTNVPLKVYCGFDPTADSLHIGNLVAIVSLAWFQKFGHTPVALIGGATGMIGDPSGKFNERQLLDEETIQKNCLGIRKNLEAILDFNHSKNPAILQNNYSWYKDFSFIGFLRDIGKYFRVSSMLAKDSVKLRLQAEEGMSFTEFSYQVLQGYDFLHLMQNHAVNVQLGGSDQWGNITAGTELIRKVTGKTAYGVTFPLLTRSDGQKFGKSEAGAIWLSPEKLSPYEFYQYFIRTPDADVIKMMRMLTFMDIEEIRNIEKSMQAADYVANTAQKRLAEEVTRLVHGEEALTKAQKATLAAAPGSDTILDAQALEKIASDIPNCDLPIQEIVGVKLMDIIVHTQLLASKGDVRRMMRNGGVYLNNQKIQDENKVVESQDLIDGKLFLISVGKKNKLLVRSKT